MTCPTPAFAPAARWTAMLMLCWALAGCGSQPPAADWALNAQSAAERATQAYLRGDQRVQALEWRKARSEVERTASPQLIARLALMRCAAAQASLDWQECQEFSAVAIDAAPAEQAYARYLQGRSLEAQDIALLPQAHQAVARSLQSGCAGSAGGAGVSTPALAAVRDMPVPLSQLVAAAVVLRACGPADGLMAQAVATASAQGWRRPLMAWLLLQRGQAHKAGDLGLAQVLERRLQVLQGPALQPALGAQ